MAHYLMEAIMKLLQKAWPVGLALILSIFPLSAFASTGEFLNSISLPLSHWSHFFLLLGFGMWAYMLDTKCVHHLVMYTLLGFIIGIFLGGIVPGMIFGVSILSLLLVLMGIMIVTQIKVHHVGGIILSIIVGFFAATAVSGGIALSLTGVLSLIGLLIGVLLGLSSGVGLHHLLKDFHKGKVIMLIGIFIGLVGLLKLFALM